jgi:hypothetical protein
MLIDRPVDIGPPSGDPQVGLIDEPPVPRNVTARPGRLDELRLPLHPPVDGDVIDGDTALGQQFLDVTAVLEPYVSDEIAWIVRHHGLFQACYYAHHLGEDRNARDRYSGTPTTRPACGSARNTTRPPSTLATAVSSSASSSRWCAASSRPAGGGRAAGNNTIPELVVPATCPIG